MCYNKATTKGKRYKKMMFETGLDYEAYEAEYEEVLAFADEGGDFLDLYEGDYDETGYNPYTGCYDFDC